MSALLGALFGPVGRWGLAALGVLAAAFAIRRSGARAARAERTAEILEDAKDAMVIRKTAERDVAAAADAELDEWLRAPGRRSAGRRQR